MSLALTVGNPFGDWMDWAPVFGNFDDEEEEDEEQGGGCDCSEVGALDKETTTTTTTSTTTTTPTTDTSTTTTSTTTTPTTDTSTTTTSTTTTAAKTTTASTTVPTTERKPKAPKQAKVRFCPDRALLMCRWVFLRSMRVFFCITAFFIVRVHISCSVRCPIFFFCIAPTTVFQVREEQVREGYDDDHVYHDDLD